MAWAPDYTTLAELKSYTRIPDDVDDFELGVAITSASRSIDEACGRQFGVVASAEARTYEAGWSQRYGLWRVDIDDVQTATGLVVTVSGSVVASSFYDLHPRNAAQLGRPWTRLYVGSATMPRLSSGPSTVQVTGLWGWTAVPDTIKQATLMQASTFFTGRNAPFGIAGSPDAGSEVRLLARLHPMVAVMVTPFRRLKEFRT